MHDPMPRAYIFARTAATILAECEGKLTKLQHEKLVALNTVLQTTNRYGADGFMREIVDTIMEKKAEMILAATTVKDIRELSLPPKPYFDGAKWHISKNSVPEEEMVMWSLTSMAAPLTVEATRRYEELFKRFFGTSINDIFNNQNLTEKSKGGV